jgi:cytochrome c551/c552
LTLSISLTGAAILLLLFQWPEREPATPEPQLPWLKRAGQGAIILGAVGMGPLVLWDLYSAPHPALSPSVYAMGLLLLLALWLAAWVGVAMLRGGHARFGWLAALLVLVAFGFFSRKEQLGYANATQEHERVMLAQADSLRAALVESREELYGAGQEVSLAIGAGIFTGRCSACHGWDQRIVGPSYNSVLPKYTGDLEGLQAFIRKPVKIDPAYPAMPSQGLRRAEARSVAAYLLTEFTGENPLGETDAAPPVQDR